jgi:hypothetical protein
MLLMLGLAPLKHYRRSIGPCGLEKAMLNDRDEGNF